MPKKLILSEPDCRALDLLLNHAAGIAMLGRCEPVSYQRIEAVRNVLARLDKMPQIDPPPGLVRRTIERIERDSVVTSNVSAGVPAETLH